MRREIVMLRAELEEMRATTHEVRKTNQLLHAYIDYILKNQYQWQREAERLVYRRLIPPGSVYRHSIDRHRVWRIVSLLLDVCLHLNGDDPRTNEACRTFACANFRARGELTDASVNPVVTIRQLGMSG
jgi:hypothetical protein